MVNVQPVMTQKELARRLGVSQSLVSRALNGSAGAVGAAPETIERIRQAASAAGYRPSPVAAALRGGSSRFFGVVVKAFEDPFFGHLVGEMQALARSHHYALLLSDGEAESLTTLSRYLPDGLMLVGSDFCPAGLDSFLQTGKPVVQIGWGQKRPGVCQVVMDQAAGLRKILDYLVELGHRNIGWIGTVDEPSRRRETFLSNLFRERGVETTPSLFQHLALPPFEAGREGMNQFLCQAPQSIPTAVIAAEDMIAHGALRALHEAGKRVPEDISVAGIDDIPSAQLATPPLTTLRQPVRAMISEAFKILVDNQLKDTKDVSIVPELIIRESCGKIGSDKGK
ncbi:MAG: LacI family DNA-binding transcriptional regulator [Verrucomicrobia bacterium]|nr:LacI family DNA-binding transcriptional regulator [Verrucomicrobiota bacterium]